MGITAQRKPKNLKESFANYEPHTCIYLLPDWCHGAVEKNFLHSAQIRTISFKFSNSKIDIGIDIDINIGRHN